MSGSLPLCLRPATQQTFIYFVHHKIGNNKKKDKYQVAHFAITQDEYSSEDMRFV